VEARGLVAGEPHQVDEDGRAEAAIHGDAFAVEAIDQVDDVLRRADVGGFDEAGVADEGEFAERCVEEMGGDVADAPAAGDGGEIPLGGGERGEEFEEMVIHSAQEMRRVDGTEAADFRLHG
jgi:hypothetical protein